MEMTPPEKREEMEFMINKPFPGQREPVTDRKAVADNTREFLNAGASLMGG